MNSSVGESVAAKDKPERSRRPAWGKIALVLALCFGLAAAWRYTPLSEYLTMEKLSGWARAMREARWAPAAVVLSYTVATVVMFPRQIITFVSVIAYGMWWAMGYAVAGVLLAALATYVAGRWIDYAWVRRICGKHLDAVKHLAHDHGVLTILASNMAPVPPFAIQGIMAGAMKVKVWQYCLGTLLSMIPGLVAVTVFGNEMAGALEESGHIDVWTIVITIAVFIAFMFWFKRWLAKHEEAYQRRKRSGA